ncbi:MAG: hypothetical protein C0613_10425 [Desulfobulbaceae bacterium]|nr:MAG: hypothetical protein C0613_10425 [Desulfobulbaceae bacterium]
MKSILCWLLAACLFTLTSPCQARQYISVESEGYGVSRKDALLDAKRQVLLKGINTLLTSQIEVKNFSLKKAMVLSRSIGAVRSYEIVRERCQGTTWFVTIRAAVSETTIRRDLAALKILLAAMDKPRLLVLVKEDCGQAAEKTIVDSLRHRGFDLVDDATIAALKQDETVLFRAATGGDARAAAQLADGTGADFIMVCRVSKGLMTSQLLEGAGMVSGRAAIRARVIDAGSGAITISTAASAGAAHMSRATAVNRAATKATERMLTQELFEQLVTSFQELINEGRPLEITFHEVTDFQTQQKITEAVQAITATSLQNHTVADGRLILSLLYRRSTDTFCQHLHGKVVQGKKLAVTRISGSRIEVSLR